MGKVYSIATQKGGVGKTTTSINLSTGLARRGKRVLLIDIDSQANSSKIFLPKYESLRKNETIWVTILDRKPLVVHPTEFESLFIVPSHILMAETDMELTTAIDHRESRLKIYLDKIKEQYDFIIIDCPPSLSWQTINALTASDYILVVI